MKPFKSIFAYYCLVVSLFLTFSAPFPLQIIFSPSALYLIAYLLKKRAHLFGIFTSKIFLYYNFIILTLIVTTGFFSIRSNADLVSSLLFFPLLIFFVKRVLPKKRKALVLPTLIPIEPTPLVKKHKEVLIEETPITPIDDMDDEPFRDHQQQFDKNRRVFIKLIGSAGISLFVFSLFTKKAQAAFFGSVPGPGTVALKDISGNPIDPAQNQPTDGYKISEMDDSSPAYYGFVNKDGAWFILKESSGGYRYVKGASSFTTNWTGRAGLTYDYYHNVF